MSARLAPEASLRDDIQGVRAVSVLLIAAFHIWEGGVSGGVDVLFVVSGYFLAAGWLRRHERGEPVDVAAHWGRFLRRTVPEIVPALLGTMVLGFVLISPFWWIDLLRDVAFAALYLENYWLIWNDDRYLARNESLSLVQHFWAVAIIAQVNLSWPALAWLAERLATRAGWSARRLLSGLLAGLVALSFGWSIVLTSTDPGAAYFDSATRAWQLGTGALLGLGPALVSRCRGTAAILLSWLGLVLVLSCGLAIGRSAAFPGLAGLWPVLAAVLLLAAGEARQPGNAGRLLAWRPLARLGAMSFGIYLWHWLLYVAVLDARQGEQPSMLQGAGIILSAVLLAWLSARLARALAALVREPRRLAWTCALALLLVAGSALALERALAWNRAAADRLFTDTLGLDVTPGPFAARTDLGRWAQQGCSRSPSAAGTLRCSHGASDAATTVFLVGGSHSAHWLPAIRSIADAAGWRLVTMTREACLFADAADASFFALEGLDPACRQWNTTVMERILTERPDVVVTLATRKLARPGTTDLGERIPDAYLANFVELTAAGITVVALRDIPWMKRNVPACVFSLWTETLSACGRSRASVLDDARVGAEAARLPAGVALVDMNDTICDAMHCGVVRDGRLIYRDSDHLTGSYTLTLVPLLGERIGAALDRIAQQRALGR